VYEHVNTYGTAVDVVATELQPEIAVGTEATTVSNSMVPASFALAVIVDGAPTIAPAPPESATEVTTKL
jgi:hypothetical protein